jgi:hypothetical protein
MASMVKTARTCNQLAAFFFSNASIQKFNSGGVGSVFSCGFTFARGLAFDSAHNLYVAENGAGGLFMLGFAARRRKSRVA